MMDSPSEPEPVDRLVLGAPGTAVLQLLPFYLRVGLKIQWLTCSLLPWGAPGLSAAGGLTSEGAEEAVLVLAYEWPVPWVRTTSRLRKRDLEWLHVRRFSTDHRLALGQMPFVGTRPGSDPPDFEVDLADGGVGLDCTALTVQERRGAHALFTDLRRQIVQLEPVVLAHLGGFMVYLWFSGDGEMQLPFRPNDEAAIEELLRALLTYRPDANQLVIPGGGLPEKAPDLGTVATPSGGAFYGVPHVNAVPDTVFSAITGFELGLVYTTEHTQSKSWQELQRLIDKHDKEGVSWLLVSAGAPNRDGQTFPTEELFARFLLQHPSPLTTPTNINRVTVHIWSTGEAFDLLPSPAKLFGPIYTSTIPTHRPIQPQPSL